MNYFFQKLILFIDFYLCWVFFTARATKIYTICTDKIITIIKVVNVSITHKSNIVNFLTPGIGSLCIFIFLIS